MTSSRPSKRLLLVLVGWTLFVWVSRIRNIVEDDDLSAGGRATRLLFAALFIAGALVVAWAAWRAPRLLTPVLVVFVVWTIGFWLVRGVGTLFGDHSAAFIAVHTVLAVVSIGLAALNWPLRRFAAQPVHG